MKIIITTALSFIFLTSGFSQAPISSLSPELRLKELSIIKSAFENLHPGLHRFNTVAEMNDHFKRLEQRLYTPIDDKAYYILLSQLTAKIKCGHTYLNPYNQKKEVGDRYFSATHIPFLYKIVDGKMIITHNLSANKEIRRGDEILAINDISVKRIIDSLLTVSRTDGNNGKLKQLDNLNLLPVDIDSSNYALFDIFFPLFFRNNFNASSFHFKIKQYKKSIINPRLEALSKKQRQEVYVKLFGEIPVNEKNWQLKFINDKTAHFSIGDFETWNWKADHKKFLDSIFTILNKSTAKNLLIDIRGNEGGNDEARDELLSYIISKPFGCENIPRKLYKYLAIPDSLLPYLTTWDKSFMKPKKETDYVRNKEGFYEKAVQINKPCVPVMPKEQRFKGQVFLLTNSSNSSTTFIMADIFRQTKAGLIIGEPTGGTKQGINGGQYLFMYLPYSKIEIDIPLIWQAPGIARPDEGIRPDHHIRTSQEDIFKGVDTQLKFTFSLTR